MYNDTVVFDMDSVACVYNGVIRSNKSTQYQGKADPSCRVVNN